MRTLRALLLLAATSTVAFCSPGGVLDKVTTIQVDPTFVEQPNSVKDPTAANLIRYNLRAAVKDSHLLEGSSPIRTHFVLDGFTVEGTAKRALGLGAGKTTNTVDGKLVIQDATGKELASVKIHMRGSVAFSSGDGSDAQGRQATSDLEQRFIEEIEKLK